MISALLIHQLQHRLGETFSEQNEETAAAEIV
jgi:hypothetical protein